MTEDITCKKVSALLSQYIDNKVTPQERACIEEHIAMCPDCYKKFIYFITFYVFSANEVKI